MNLEENLVERYIAYLDVLGFKELVFQKNLTALEEYFLTVNKSLATLKSEQNKIESFIISDSIILIVPDSTEDFKLMLRAIQTIQSELIFKDIWIRGAVSFGEIFYDKMLNLIIGKGIINAYLLEQEAKFPRVIIDPKIIPRIAENRQSFYNTINPLFENFESEKLKLVHSWYEYIKDDAFFIDYAYKILLDSINETTIDPVFNVLKCRLYSDQKYYDKFLWVKNYFMDSSQDLYRKFDRDFKKPNQLDTYKHLKKCWDRFCDL